jgi:hypothetical protein
MLLRATSLRPADGGAGKGQLRAQIKDLASFSSARKPPVGVLHKDPVAELGAAVCRRVVGEG